MSDEAIRAYEQQHAGKWTAEEAAILAQVAEVIARGANGALTLVRSLVAQPGFDEAAFKRMTEKGAKAWADVPDASRWVEELRGNADTADAARWRLCKVDPAGARHLLRLLELGKGDAEALDSMMDRIMQSRIAAGLPVRVCAETPRS